MNSFISFKKKTRLITPKGIGVIIPYDGIIMKRTEFEALVETSTLKEWEADYYVGGKSPTNKHTVTLKK